MCSKMYFKSAPLSSPRERETSQRESKREREVPEREREREVPEGERGRRERERLK